MTETGPPATRGPEVRFSCHRLEERVAILEVELCVRDERFARIEPLIAPLQMLHSFVHEPRHRISALGVSLDRLLTLKDRQRDSSYFPT